MRYKTSMLALLFGLGIYGIGPVAGKFGLFAANPAEAKTIGNWVGAPSSADVVDDADDGGDDDGDGGDGGDDS